MSMHDHPSFRQYLIKETTMTDTNAPTIPADRQESYDALAEVLTALYGADPVLAIVLGAAQKSAVEDTDNEWNLTLSKVGYDIASFRGEMRKRTVDPTDPEDVEAHRAANAVSEPLSRLATIVSGLLRKASEGDPVVNRMLDLADDIRERESQKRREAEAAQPE